MTKLIHTIAADKDQSLEVIANYDHRNNTFDTIAINVYKKGKWVANILYLLEIAQGNPLDHLLGAINWRKIYRDQKADQRNFFNRYKGFFSLFQNQSL